MFRANYVEKKFTESADTRSSQIRNDQTKELEKLIRGVVFLWTMMNVERIVSAINKPELMGIIKDVRDKMNTPAYDMIYYFCALDVANSFDKSEKKQLEDLLDKYDKKEMAFMHRVLSIRTQQYINTHRIKGPIKQATSSLLKIDYKGAGVPSRR